jgi:hypothetical protein
MKVTVGQLELDRSRPKHENSLCFLEIFGRKDSINIALNKAHYSFNRKIVVRDEHTTCKVPLIDSRGYVDTNQYPVLSYI